VHAGGAGEGRVARGVVGEALRGRDGVVVEAQLAPQHEQAGVRLQYMHTVV